MGRASHSLSLAFTSAWDSTRNLQTSRFKQWWRAVRPLKKDYDYITESKVCAKGWCITGCLWRPRQLETWPRAYILPLRPCWNSSEVLSIAWKPDENHDAQNKTGMSYAGVFKSMCKVRVSHSLSLAFTSAWNEIRSLQTSKWSSQWKRLHKKNSAVHPLQRRRQLHRWKQERNPPSSCFQKHVQLV